MAGDVVHGGPLGPESRPTVVSFSSASDGRGWRRSGGTWSKSCAKTSPTTASRQQSSGEAMTTEGLSTLPEMDTLAASAEATQSGTELETTAATARVAAKPARKARPDYRARYGPCRQCGSMWGGGSVHGEGGVSAAVGRADPTHLSRRLRHP
jgi:hypothetical protein